MDFFTALEVIAVVTGLASVWFAKKENILVYPVGIVSVLIYVYICFIAGLYADMGINFYYFLVSIYGWYMWMGKGKSNQPLPIGVLRFSENMVNILLGFTVFLLLYFILSKFTDSDVPFWDSLTTSFFIVAMLLMAKKKIEHWIFWIIGDLISVPLYFYKGLYFTSFQYVVFLIIAVLGYIEWKRKLKLLNV